jgi:hypothetical protein
MSPLIQLSHLHTLTLSHTHASSPHSVVLLLEELEDIASALGTPSGSTLPRGWTLDCLTRIGLTCGAAAECFLGFTDKWGSKTSEERAHLVSSTSLCLTEWRKIAMR